MKNVIITLLLIAGTIGTGCDSKKVSDRADKNKIIKTSDVPQPVQTAFSAKYPGVTEVFWEDAHEGSEESFKVKFKREGKYWKAEFKADGSLIKEKEDE